MERALTVGRALMIIVIQLCLIVQPVLFHQLHPSHVNGQLKSVAVTVENGSLQAKNIKFTASLAQ